jgi:hypothetical protein
MGGSSRVRYASDLQRFYAVVRYKSEPGFNPVLRHPALSIKTSPACFELGARSL